MLDDLERRAELVKAKVLTAAEDAVVDHQATPLAEHFAAYLAHQTGEGIARDATSAMPAAGWTGCLPNCGFDRLADLNAAALERWLARPTRPKECRPATRNEYRQELVAFCNWCVRTHRLIGNPFASVPKADAKADRRRKRRAMTEAELVKLLDVARRRPLLDAMTVRRGKRQSEAVAKFGPTCGERLELLGRERALIYKTLVLTGLRQGELASLTVGQLDLDGPMPICWLHAADEKNRQGSQLPAAGRPGCRLRHGLPICGNGAAKRARRSLAGRPACR